jgi:anthranilate synthase component 1
MLALELDPALDLVELKHSHPALFPCLFESVARAHGGARFDVLFAGSGEYLEEDCHGQVRAHGWAPVDAEAHDFMSQLKCWQQVLPVFESPQPLGLVVLLSYEFADRIETKLKLPRAPGRLPRALALRTPVIIVRDHQKRSVIAYGERPYQHLFDQVLRVVRQASVTPMAGDEVPLPAFELNVDVPEQFIRGVQRIKSHLSAGDIFQANLSRGWCAHALSNWPGYTLYRRLRRSNPAPFAAWLSCADWQLFSSSPERLLRVRGDLVETRPIAGTRARSVDEGDWLSLPRDPKERAEHVMLIDLERNDLGRVCLPGSVAVDELLQVETYAHVHHIVSNVRGQLRPECSSIDALKAVFPGGTITGCPKLRAMQIIAEIEGIGRGPYTGSLGFVSGGRYLDFNILIRSMWSQGNSLRFRAGAGIVADSDPEKELLETQAKAEGMLKALQ